MRHGGGVEGRGDGEVLGAVEAELPEEVVDLCAAAVAAADAEAGLRCELGGKVGRRGVAGAFVLAGVRRVPHRVDARQLRPRARPWPLRRRHGWDGRAVAAGLPGLALRGEQGRARGEHRRTAERVRALEWGLTRRGLWPR